jgi:hypothetical protein
MCKKFLVLVIVFCFAASLAQASLYEPHQYVDPTSYVDASNITGTASATHTWQSGGDYVYGPDHTCDESGLMSDDEDVPEHSVLYHENTSTERNMWLSQAPGSVQYDSSGGSQTQTGASWIHYDLGDTYTLVDLLVFNFNEKDGGTSYTDYGMRDVYIEYSTDDDTWSMLGTGTIEFAQANASDWYEGFTVDMGNVSARYVVMTADSTNPDWRSQTDSAGGLSEVRFHTPEPATIALLGLGSLALLRRRR